MLSPYEFNLDRSFLLKYKWEDYQREELQLLGGDFNKKKFILTKDKYSSDFRDYKLIPYYIRCELFYQKNDYKNVSVTHKGYYSTLDKPAIQKLFDDGHSYISDYEFLSKVTDNSSSELDKNIHLWFTEISFYLANGQIIWVQLDGLPFSVFGHNRNICQGQTYYLLDRHIQEMFNRDEKYFVKPRTRWKVENYNHAESELLKELNEKNYFTNLKEKISQLPKRNIGIIDPNRGETIVDFEYDVIDSLFLRLEYMPNLFRRAFDFLGSNDLDIVAREYYSFGNIIPKIPSFDHPFFKILG